MSITLSVSGVFGASEGQVAVALGLESCDGVPDEPGICAVVESDSNTTVLYPYGYNDGDGQSARVSDILAAPVLSLHMRNSRFWMYRLFVDGEEAGRFNPLPDYLGEVRAEERERWRGDAAQLCALVPATSPEIIQRYLVAWDQIGDNPDPAHPDDDAAAGDPWQMLDFMERLGLTYPVDGDGLPIGRTYRMIVAQTLARAQTLERKKLWWRRR